MRNADESEPGTFCNRVLMEHDPHQVIEGTIRSAYATRASYRPTSTFATNTRSRISGSKRPSTSAMRPGSWVRISSGVNSPWTSTFTAGLRRIFAAKKRASSRVLRESGRGRGSSPFSGRRGVVPQADGGQQRGDDGLVVQILDRGVEWFKSMGVPPSPDDPRDPGSYGPKLYCISGHVNRPGCYEAPLGLTCRQVIEEFGGGVWKGRLVRRPWFPAALSTGP